MVVWSVENSFAAVADKHLLTHTASMKVINQDRAAVHI